MSKYIVQYTRTFEGNVDFDKTDMTKEEFRKMSWLDQHDFLDRHMRDIESFEMVDWGLRPKPKEGE